MCVKFNLNLKQTDPNYFQHIINGKCVNISFILIQQFDITIEH